MHCRIGWFPQTGQLSRATEQRVTEAEFLAALRTLPLHPGARGLGDDCAQLDGHILTTDTMVEGAHFLATDPAGDVAWKLLAVNLSDLAAKGATPAGVLLNYPLGEEAWDRAFLAGLGQALAAFDCALLGGDTVTLPPDAPRVLTLTAIGQVPAVVPVRSGARAGDNLYVTGIVGDAGAGLAIAQGAAGPASLLAAYRRPVPRIAEGRALASLATAMMDVSDGVLIDAARMAAASGLSVTVDLAALPLSADYAAHIGDDRAARLKAATAGDDYQLLFAAPAGLPLPVDATPIGHFGPGRGLSLVDGDAMVPLPDRLGYQHAGRRA